MARKVTPVPKGYRTANPVLIVRGADAALSYYETVFGAEVLSRDYAQDGTTMLQAEMKIGNTILRVADEMPAFGIFSPTSLGGSPVIVQLYLSEVDAFWTRVVDNGAQVAVPLADTYWGERFGRLVDPFGHVWNIAKRTEMLRPGEIGERATVAFSIQEPEADLQTSGLAHDDIVAQASECLEGEVRTMFEVIDGTIEETPQPESEPAQSVAR